MECSLTFNRTNSGIETTSTQLTGTFTKTLLIEPIVELKRVIEHFFEMPMPFNRTNSGIETR